MALKAFKASKDSRGYKELLASKDSKGYRV
jgi:hypothetical protein